MLSLLRTCRNTHGVVLHDAVREQQIEPVGVAIFLLAQPLVAGSVGVEHLTRSDQSGELSIDTARVGIHHIGRTHITLLGQLLINRHLFLRIHDVEVLVVGNQSHREFTRVVHIGLAGLTFLGIDNDHTSHSAGTVDRGCRTVAQNLERLDVVGIQTGDSRREQCLGITRRKVVGVHLDDVLLNDTVHNPQRLRVAVDRRSTTNLDAGSRTERTRHILNRHTSGTTFQRTRDIGHTVELGFLGIDERRRTRKQSLVHLVHTRHDNIAKRVGIALEDNVQRLQTGLAAIGLHADIRILQHIALTHTTQRVVAVAVGDRCVLRTGHFHCGTNQPVAISIEQPTRDRVAACRPAVLLTGLAVNLNELTLGGSTVGQPLQQLSYSLQCLGIANICRHLLLAEVSVVVVDFVITRLLLHLLQSCGQWRVITFQSHFVALCACSCCMKK